MFTLNLVNHLLQQNPEVCHDLTGFNGLVLGVHSASFHFHGRINEYGLLDPATRKPDTILILHNNGLSKILQGQFPHFNDLALEGDIELGMNLMRHFIRVRYQPYQDLYRFLGDDLAIKFTQKAYKLGEIFQTIGNILVFQANQITPNQMDLEILTQELKHTRQRLAQLETRLQEYSHNTSSH